MVNKIFVGKEGISEEFSRCVFVLNEIHEFRTTGKPFSPEGQKVIDEMLAMPPEELRRQQEAIVASALDFIKKADLNK